MARNGKFVIKQGRGGKTHFVLLASNGRIVVTSETYESKQPRSVADVELRSRRLDDAPMGEHVYTSTPDPSDLRGFRASG